MESFWGGLGDAHIHLMLALLLAPLAAFTIQIFFGRWMPRGGDWIPTGAMAISLGIAIYLFSQAMSVEDGHRLLLDSRRPTGFGPSGLPNEGFAWNWLYPRGESLGAPVVIGSVLFDNITAVMLVVVTLVSFLVHVFSIGYMRGDARYGRFFAYLAIFSFAMLGLVLSGNMLFLLIFWELVGLSSYLLIGFWFEKPSAADACKKAFLTTRVGDCGMLVGMAMIFLHYRTFDFQEIFANAAREVAENGNAPPVWMTTAGILTFLGPVGKSAQFPLHIWLPDAMEGPTPVSALIHAATMVVAGVYLVARLFPFYMFVPDAMLVIALVGGFTALFAATIGICQFDIKKVLAYSTVSQLGFMMTALGCGALGAGVMHLMTHAWFKACLFLGSGSVIHGMHHEQDMRRMGGLRRKMPVTYVTMLISTLAISGIPLFSGFYSKDSIIAAALHPQAGYPSVPHGGHGEGFLWKLPIVFLSLGAAITAFYMFRLIFMTFHGEPKSHHAEEAHESPAIMTMPLVVLAVLAVFGASPWILNFDFLGTHIWFNERVVNTAFEAGRVIRIPPPEVHHPHWDAMAISIGVAAAGILLACVFYLWRLLDPAKMAQRFGGLYTLVYNKYYIDELVVRFVVRPLVFQWNVLCAAFDKYVVDGLVNAVGSVTKVGAFRSGWFDKNIVDGAVNALAFFMQLTGALARVLQTGFLHHYVTALAGGVVAGLTLFYFFL